DAQDGEQERDEHQQADQPHIDPEGRGEAARDPGEEALGAAAEAETTQGIEEVRHVVNDRQALGFAQWGQPTWMMEENRRSTARRSAGSRPETSHLPMAVGSSSWATERYVLRGSQLPDAHCAVRVGGADHDGPQDRYRRRTRPRGEADAELAVAGTAGAGRCARGAPRTRSGGQARRASQRAQAAATPHALTAAPGPIACEDREPGPHR